MKITAASIDQPLYITAIEVFAVDRQYTKKHYIADKIGFFVTERGIFIGYRQSAMSMIVGIPNAGREDKIGPRDVIRKKGTPTEIVKENKLQVFTYKLPNVSLSDGSANYQARYEFYKNSLYKFEIKLENLKLSDSKFGE